MNDCAAMPVSGGCLCAACVVGWEASLVGVPTSCNPGPPNEGDGPRIHTQLNTRILDQAFRYEL